MNFQIPQLTLSFYGASFPIILFCVTGIVALLMGVSKNYKSVRASYWLNNSVLVVALLAIIRQYAVTGAASEVFLSGGFVAGRLGYFGQGVIVGIALVVSLLMGEGYMKPKFFRGEIIALFHMVLAGMLTMVATDDLITLFVGLEMASIGIYALIGYVNPTKISQEGAI